MDASEVLNAVIESDDDFDWNESSPEGSDDEEDETPNLLNPLSNAEVNSSVLLVQYFILMPFL